MGRLLGDRYNRAKSKICWCGDLKIFTDLDYQSLGNFGVSGNCRRLVVRRVVIHTVLFGFKKKLTFVIF